MSKNGRSRGPHINRFSSDIKDIIVSSIEKSFNAINKSVAIVAEPTSYDEFVDIGEDLVVSTSEEIGRPIIDEDDKENCPAEIQLENSIRPVSPIISFDLVIKSKSVLYYGIKPSDMLFPLADAFLRFAIFNGLESYDPNTLFFLPTAKLALFQGFDIGCPGFKGFCNHLRIQGVPITSPLYGGPRKTNEEKLTVKRMLLVNLVREESVQININFNIETMIESINSKYANIDYDLIEFFIGQIREKISNYLLALDVNGSFISGFELAVKQGCISGMSLINMPEDKKLFDLLVEQFLSLFESPLALLKKSDSVEQWKTFYDEGSPTLKFKSLFSPISGGIDSSSKTSGRKSVTIDEDNNKVCILPREDIFGTINDDETIGIPLKRTSSLSHNLSSMNDFNLNSHLPSPGLKDPIEGLLNLAEQVDDTDCDFDFDAPTLNLPQAQGNKEKDLNQFSKKEVPDFPFDDSVATILDPFYIKTTGIYALQNGNDACFMLDERLNSFKDGLAIFLRGSFENSKVIGSIERIFSENLNSIFK